MGFVGRSRSARANAGITPRPGALPSASPYWSSDGQTQIKQNEAFVRVWRHVLSFAARTITNWADPKGEIGRDILGASQRETAVKNLNSEAFDQTAEVLFGGSASLICGHDLEARRAALKLGLSGLGRLRNAAFHFGGVSSFLKALDRLGDQTDEGALDAVHMLFSDDQRAFAKRLSDDLRSVDAEYFLSQEQLDQLLMYLSKSEGSYNGLPDFQKVLGRGQSRPPQDGRHTKLEFVILRQHKTYFPSTNSTLIIRSSYLT